MENNYTENSAATKKFNRWMLLNCCIVFCIFSSNAIAQTTLISSDFEPSDATGWTFVDAATNKWVIGTATNNGGTQGIYVSNDAGVSNAYTNTATTFTHFYKTVTFPAGETAVVLKFDWKGIGEHSTSNTPGSGTSWDYMRVSVSATAPTSSAMPATVDQIAIVYNAASGYTTAYVTIPASMATGTKHIIFSWYNDSSGGSNPPSAVDNVSVISSIPTPISGTKSIPGDYATLGHAFANLNANGVGAGGVTFNVVAGSVFNETPTYLTATGTVSDPIVFQKSGVGANPLIIGNGTGNYGPTSATSLSATGDAIIAIVGGDYITIDGIDVQSLNYVTGISSFEYGITVRNASATNGAQNNTIKNTNITMNRFSTSGIALYQSATTTGGGFTPTAASGNNSNNKYYNITIQNSYNGILLTSGSTSFTDDGNQVGTTGGGTTTIGASYSGVPTGDIGGGSTSVYGVQMNNQGNFKVFNCLVRNLTATTTNRGIFASGAVGTSEINNNKIQGLRSISTTSTSGQNGIEATLSSTGTHSIRIYNNMISDITSAYTSSASSSRQLKGILLGSGTATSSYNVDFNSVSIDGSGSLNISSTCLEFGSSTPINNVRNNAFANFTGAQAGVAKHTCIRSTSATSYGAASSVCNYNDYYIPNSTNGPVGITNSTDQPSIGNWTAALTGNPNTDINSFNADPIYTNNNTDLHASASALNGTANMTGISWVTTDFDGAARNSPHDVGADDFTPLTLDMGATALAAPGLSGCKTAATTVTVTIKNFAAPTIDFSVDPVTVSVTATGGYSDNILLNSGTLASGATLNVTMGSTIDMSAAGSYTFNASTSVSGDGNAGNDAMAPAVRSNNVVALPQTCDFTGFTGSNLTAVFPNWREAAGATLPAGTTSAWVSSTSLITTTAKINFFSTSKLDWIVGPEFVPAANTVLTYKIAITDFGTSAPDPSGMQGTDDRLVVKISTDCGLTYTDLLTYDAANTTSISNSLVSQLINLGAYAGQNCIIAFFGTDGPVDDLPDYDFHIDDINIDAGCSGAPTAGTASALPTGPFCNSGSPVLSVSGQSTEAGISLQWYKSATSGSGYLPISGATSASYTATGTTTTSYFILSVKCIISGDSSLTNEIEVVVNAVTAASIAPTAISICPGDNTTLTASPSGSGETYLWSPGGATTDAISVSPGSTTSYLVTVTDVNSCTSSASATVTVAPAVTAGSSVSPTNICADGSANIITTATSGTSGSDFTVSNNSGTISTTVPDNSLTGVSSNLSISGGVGVIDANSTVSVTLSATMTFNGDLDIYLIGPGNCGTLELSTDNGSSGDNYTNVLLRTPSAFASITSASTTTITGNFSPEGTYLTAPGLASGTLGGSYSLPATSLAGCPVDGTWSLFIGDDANGDIAILTNWQLSLSGAGNYTHSISGPGTIGSIAYSGSNNSTGTAALSAVPTGSNLYTVTTTSPTGCTTTSTATLNVNDLAVSATPTDASCFGYADGSIAALASGGTAPYEYSLDGSIWQSSATFSGLSAGTYTIYVKDATPCTVSTAPVVISSPAQLIVSASNSGPVCDGTDVTLTATSGFVSYSWSGPNSYSSSANPATVTAPDPSYSGVYVVTVSDGSCNETASTTVAVDPIGTISVSLAASSNPSCDGLSVTYTATPANASSPTYDFYVNGGSVQNTASATYSYVPTAGDQIYVIMTAAPSGCATGSPATSNTITQTTNTNPAAPTITAGGPTTFCANISSVTLTSSYTGGNTWSTTETTDAITVNTSGSYTVTYTDGNGCSATSAPEVVTANTSSVSIVSSNPSGLCTGGSVTLTATATPAAISYAWAPGGETTQAISVTAAGTYDVLTTDGNGCTATNSITVVDNAIPTASITGNSTICTGTTETLTASATAGSGTVASYQWVLNGTTNVSTNYPTYDATAPGSYTITVTNTNGCSFTSVAHVLAPTGPLSGTYSINGTLPASCTNYLTIASAISDLNTKGVSGHVIFNVAGGFTSVAPAGGLVINYCALAPSLKPSATQTVSFIGGTPHPIVTAQVGTSTSTDGIIKLVGADFVSFDGIDVVDPASNATATTRMEWGYALLKCDGNDGSNSNTIKNCVITLQKAHTSSVGIYSGNHNATSTTGLTYSGGINDLNAIEASRNGRNVFYGNAISNVYNGISLNGNSASAGGSPPYSLNDSLNEVGQIGQAVNSITNFGGASTAANGIIETNQRGLKINNNSINGGTGSTGTVIGISMISGVWGEIRNNTVTLASSATTSAMTGITCGFSGGDLANPNTITINGNTVSGISFTTATSATFTGITSTAGGTGAVLNVSSNTVTGNTHSGTGTFTGINFSGSPTSGVITYNSNTVTNNTKTGTGTLSCVVSGHSSATATMSMNNNTITGNNFTGTFAAACTFNGMTTSTTIMTQSGNTISSCGVSSITTGVATITGISNIGASTPSSLVSNNTISNLTVNGTSTSAHVIRGINHSTSTTDARTISGNTITNLTTNAASSAAVTGIITGTGGTVNVFNNTVCALFAGQSTGTSVVKCISNTSGTNVTIYNNRLKVEYNGSTFPYVLTGSNAIVGLEVTGGTNVNAYFNTIHITGSGTSNFGSSGIHLTSTTPNVDLRNNLVNNLSTASGTGLIVALRRSAAAVTGYSSLSNNNIYYAGTPSATNLIYYDGTAGGSYQTIAALQGGANISPRESASKSEAVSFQNITCGNINFLKVNTGVATNVEGGAQAIAGITSDFFGTTRNSTSPDIGAHEDNFINLNTVVTSATANPASGVCVAQDHHVTAVVTPAGAAIVTGVNLNYAFNGTAGGTSPIAMVNTSGNIWEADIPAATSPTNALVTWSVTATDNTPATVTANGASYSDDPLVPVAMTATAIPASTCPGLPITLNVVQTSGSSISSYSVASAAYSLIPTPGAGVTTLATGGAAATALTVGTIDDGYWTVTVPFSFKFYNSNYTSVAIGSNGNIQFGTYATQGYGNTLPSSTTPNGMLAALFGDLNTNVGTVEYFTNGTAPDRIFVVNWTAVNWWSATPSASFQAKLYENGGYMEVHLTSNTAGNTHVTGVENLAGTAGISPPGRASGTWAITTPEAWRFSPVFADGLTFAWTEGANSVGSGASVTTTSPVTAGTYTYTVTATNPLGCTRATTVDVIVNPQPATPTANDDTQCGVGVPTCSVTGGGGTFRWYLTPTGGSPLAGETANQLSAYSISVTTTFYVVEWDGTCESDRVAVTQTVTTPPAITASNTASNPTCPFVDFDLSSTDDGGSYTSFSWSASPASGSGIPTTLSGNPVTIQATSGGTFVYTVTATGSGCSTTSTTSVTVTAPPALDSITAVPNPVCAGGSVALNVYSAGLASGPQVAPSGYCVSGSSTLNADEQIFGVSFGSMVNNQAETCASNYTDYTGTITPPTVSAGNSVPFEVRQNECDGATFYANGVSIFIDYNRDGDFLDAGEQAFTTTATTAATGASPAGDNVRSGNITIPLTVSAGLTRMRVVMIEGVTSPDACAAYTYGETEDYLVDIIGVVTQDPAKTYTWNPGSLTGASVTVNPTTTTTYTATVTASGNTCSNQATVTVTAIPLPATPTANDDSQCGVGVPTCSVTGGGGVFRWYLTSTGGTPLAGETSNSLSSYSISVTTTFYVSEFDGTCESERVAVTQTVIQPDAITAFASSPTCLNQVINLTVTKASGVNTYDYTWNASPLSGSGLSGVTPGDVADGHLDVTPTATGTYSYTVTGFDPTTLCSVESIVTVTVTDYPVLDSVTVSSSSVCEGGEVTLNAYSSVIGSGPQTQPTGYCTLGLGTNNADEQIFGVSFGSMVNNQSELCTANYTDYTGTVPAPTVTAGTSVPFEVRQNECDGATFYNNGFSIYIDYNRDGDFDDAGEQAYTTTATSAATGASPAGDNVRSGNITIPATASVGVTRMRVVMVEGVVSPTACHVFTWGEAEDYIINILNIVPQNSGFDYSWNPGGMTGATATANPTASTIYTVTATNPASGCATSGTVSVTVIPLPAAPVASSPSNQCGYGIPTCSVTGSGGIFNWYLTPTGGSPLAGETGSSLVNYYINSSTTFYVSEFDGNCEGPRSAVDAIVVQPDAITASSSSPSCSNSQMTLSVVQTGSTNVYSYAWTASPAANSGVPSSTPGDVVDGHLDITPTAAGTYEYTVTGTDGICVATSTVSVIVTESPAIDSITASPNPVCEGSTVNLNVYSAGISSGPQTLPGTYCAITNAGEVCVTNVVFNTMNASPPACVAPNYYNINAGTATTVSAGSTHTLTVSLASSPSYPTGGIVSVWIDWNRDGVFSATEWYQPYTAALTGSVSVTVPANAAAGLTGMRVRSRGAGNPNGSGDGCTGFGSGSSEDFTIEVLGIAPVNPALSYTWNPGGMTGASATANPTTNTTYTVTVTDPTSGCSSTSSVAVSVLALPPAPTASAPSVQCGVGVPTVSVTGSGGTFRWYLVPTGGTALAGEIGDQLVSYSISTSTSFYVSEFDGSCEGPRVQVDANVIAPDALTLTPSSSTICGNAPLTLTTTQTGSTNVYTYAWSASPLSGSGVTGSETGDVIVVTPTTGGTYTYTVTGTDASSNCVTSSTTTVDVTAPPALLVSANPTVVCAGVSSDLLAQSLVIGTGPQVLPTGYCASGTSTSNADEQIFGVTFGSMVNNQTETCTSNYTDYSGSITAPTVTAGASVAFEVRQNECDGATFYANGVSIYIDYNRDGDFDDAGEQVYTSASTSAATGASPGGDNVRSGSIIIPSSASAGLTKMRVIMIEGVGSPTACQSYTWGETEDYAVNIESLVDAPGITFTWEPGTLTGASQTVTPSVTTTYTVTATDPSTTCSSTATVTVTVASITATPTIDANPTTLCGSGTVNLSVTNAEAGLEYSWESSATGVTDTWTFIGSGSTYTTGTISSDTYFRVFATCGTAGDTSASVFVTVLNPNITSAPPVNRCGPGSVTLMVTGNGTFDWYANSSGGTALATGTDTYTASYVSTTTLWVQAYIGSCLDPAGRQPISAVIDPGPVVNVAASPGTTICDGTELTLTATSTNDPNYTYGWSTNGSTIIANGPVYVVTPTANTTYYAHAQDNSSGTYAGCAALVATSITVQPTPPTPIIAPSSAAICNTGGCVDLTVSNAVGSTPGIATVGTTASTTQGGSPFRAGGGVAMRSQYLFTAAELTASGLTAGNFTSIAWNFTTASGGTLPNYTVKIGHTGVAALAATFETAPATTVFGPVSVNPPTVTGLFTLTFTAPFNWDGAQNVLIDVCHDNPSPTAGSGSVEAMTTSNLATNQALNAAACAATNGTTQTLRPTPRIGGEIGTAISYTWNPGGLTGTTVNVCPTATTTYTVTAEYPNGCTSSSTVTVTYDPVTTPTITPGGPTTFCQGGSVTLDAGTGYTNYVWNDGTTDVGFSQTYVASPAATTTYTVTVDNGGTCTASASVTVTIEPLTAPTITPSGPTSFCQGGSVTLDAGSGYASYSWDDGSTVVGTSQTYNATVAATYTVTVTASNGCSATASEVVMVNPNPPPAVITPAGPINLCNDGSNGPVTLTADTTGTGGGGTISWNDIFGATGPTYDVYWDDFNIDLNGGTYDFEVTITNSFGCSNSSNAVTVNTISCGGVAFNIKVFMQGYYTGSGTMAPVLQNQAVIGATGVETDTITVELRDVADPTIIMGTTQSLIGTDGMGSCSFATASGTYWIAVKHRNSVQTWSANPVSLPIPLYDFTSASTQSFADNVIDVFSEGIWSFYTGDLNQDEFIDIFDFADFDLDNQNFVAFEYKATDMNGDGFVDIFDFAVYDANNQNFIFSIHP